MAGAARTESAMALSAVAAAPALLRDKVSAGARLSATQAASTNEHRRIVGFVMPSTYNDACAVGDRMAPPAAIRDESQRPKSFPSSRDSPLLVPLAAAANASANSSVVW